MNRNVWLLSVLLVSWVVLSTFWYTCRIKGACFKLKTEQHNLISEVNPISEHKMNTIYTETDANLDSMSTLQVSDSTNTITPIAISDSVFKIKNTLPKLPCPTVDLNSAVPQITDILFRHGSSTVECTYIVKKFASVAKVYLSENSGSIEVVGHSDNSPKSVNSFTLGLKRALAVKLLLMKAGIPSDRIITNSMAETAPVADNSTENGRQQNRRVSIKIK
jgi:outer membrane protein OmpA-like peptidoglycan-associated protein